MEIHILAHGEIDVKVEQQNCSSVLSVVLNEDKPESQGGAFGGIRKKKNTILWLHLLEIRCSTFQVGPKTLIIKSVKGEILFGENTVWYICPENKYMR